MPKVVYIEENMRHKVSEVICVKCGFRYIATRPAILLDKDLYCPNCDKKGFIIETGEELWGDEDG